jgi:hypothetical protein
MKGGIDTTHSDLPAHALHAAQVCSKSVSHEGRFTSEAETIFCPYSTSRFSGVTDTARVALPALALQALQVW